MKGKIFKIKNMEDELVLPVTTAEAVYMEDGETILNDEIKNINSSLDTLGSEVDNINSSLDNKVNDVVALLDNKANKDEIGKPTQEQVNKWLDNNPQATTTVLNKSISEYKLSETSSRAFRYEETAQYQGYKYFLYPEFEIGALDTTSGMDKTSTTYFRTKDYIYLEEDINIIPNNFTTQYFVYKFDAKGNLVSAHNFIKGYFLLEKGFKYRISSPLNGETEPNVAGRELFTFVVGKSDECINANMLSETGVTKRLNFNETAFVKGYNKEIILSWNKGGMFNGSGVVTGNTRTIYSDYIFADDDLYLYLPNTGIQAQVVKYDSDKKFVERVINLSQEFNKYKLEKGYYYRFSLYNSLAENIEDIDTEILSIYTGNVSRKLFRLVYPNCLIIDKNGNGDYTTISEAIIKNDPFYGGSASKQNPVTFILLPGTYVENVRLRDGMALVGVDRESCIVEWTNHGEVKYVIDLLGNSSISNLTVKALADTDDFSGYALRSYAVHCDNDVIDDSRAVIDNCELISNQTYALGIGMQKSQYLRVSNCHLTTTVEMPSIIVHGNTNQVKSKFIMENCYAYNEKGTPYLLSLLYSDKGNEYHFWNNTFYSGTDNSLINGVQIVGVHPDSHGNNYAPLNYVISS